MPSLARSSASGPFRLVREAHSHFDPELLQLFGLSTRTLVSDGPLRVSLVALAAGGTVPPHRAAGPTTLHLLEGALELRLGSARKTLEPGDVLSIGEGVEHELSTVGGARFLLTLVDADACPRACPRVPGA